MPKRITSLIEHDNSDEWRNISKKLVCCPRTMLHRAMQSLAGSPGPGSSAPARVWQVSGLHGMRSYADATSFPATIPAVLPERAVRATVALHCLQTGLCREARSGVIRFLWSHDLKTIYAGNMRRVRYDAVPKQLDAVGVDPPVFRSAATLANQLEQELRQKPGLPQTGLIFIKVEGFWENLAGLDPLPLDDPVEAKLVHETGISLTKPCLPLSSDCLLSAD